MDDSHTTGVTVDRGLVAHAAVMTLLGLLSGFTPAFVKSPTAALETHTIGVLQGAMLFGLAAVWPSLGSGWAVRVARYCALVGLYANWIGAQLAAVFERQGDVHRYGGFNAWRSRTVDGSCGGRALEFVATRYSHVPADPMGVAQEACDLKSAVAIVRLTTHLREPKSPPLITAGS